MSTNPLNEKYSYPEGCKEISGFGGEYEQECRRMVIAGMKWFDRFPNASPRFKTYKNIYGIVVEEGNQKHRLTDAILDESPDCSGAMMQASISHCLFASKNGWDKYIREMQKPKEG